MFVIIAFKNPKADDPTVRHSGLGITASNLAEVLGDNNIPSQALAVANGETLWAALNANARVTHVAICAPFFDTAFLEKMVRNFPRVQFTVTIHSNWGFLQQDHWAITCLGKQLDLQKRVNNFVVSGNCEKFTQSTTEAFGENVAFLPNLYYQHGIPCRNRQITNGNLHIGIYGATRVLKNMLTGVVSSIIIGRRMKAQTTTVHISSGRTEFGDGVVKTVRQLVASVPNFELVEEGWASWPDFRINLRKMNLMLQPSFTETFNNVTADGACEGVPSVVGHSIEWVPQSWRANADSAESIADTGMKLLCDTKSSLDGFNSLAQHNAVGLWAWRNWLEIPN